MAPSFRIRRNLKFLACIELLAKVLIISQIQTFVESSSFATSSVTNAHHSILISRTLNAGTRESAVFKVSVPIRASGQSNDRGSISEPSQQSPGSFQARINTPIEPSSGLSKSHSESTGQNGLLPTGSMKSPECYFELIQRFQEWLRKYRALQQASKKATKTAQQVLQEEQENIDERLVDEECSKSESSQFFIRTNFNIKDFVYRYLRKLVEQLQRRLLEVEEETEEEVKGTFEHVVDFMLNDSLTTELAMERLKKEIITRAKNELVDASILAASNSLAALSAALPGNPRTTVEYIDSILELILHVGPSKAVNYIRDSQLRSGLTTLNQMNPMSFLKCYDDDLDDADGDIKNC